MEEVKTGAFIQSLKRNNKQIREDRALSISEDAEVIYKRTVEDLKIKLKRMKRDLENMLDLSPDTATSLKLASDFDANDYVIKDMSLGVKIRQTEIELEIAEKRYSYLFGGE